VCAERLTCPIKPTVGPKPLPKPDPLASEHAPGFALICRHDLLSAFGGRHEEVLPLPPRHIAVNLQPLGLLCDSIYTSRPYIAYITTAFAEKYFWHTIAEIRTAKPLDLTQPKRETLKTKRCTTTGLDICFCCASASFTCEYEHNVLNYPILKP